MAVRFGRIAKNTLGKEKKKAHLPLFNFVLQVGVGQDHGGMEPFLSPSPHASVRCLATRILVL